MADDNVLEASDTSRRRREESKRHKLKSSREAAEDYLRQTYCDERREALKVLGVTGNERTKIVKKVTRTVKIAACTIGVTKERRTVKRLTSS
eukprot:GHVU01109329.1.p1 GENE.GHVU01109329.1~~GHVU01109329.1.p1  ORF type:complete len:107 (+),score=16.80 GHVU01109329.1:46-321(+)